MDEFLHIPVLLGEIINYIKKAVNGKNNPLIVDATMGDAGHTIAIRKAFPEAFVLEQMLPGSSAIGCLIDPALVAAGPRPRACGQIDDVRILWMNSETGGPAQLQSLCELRPRVTTVRRFPQTTRHGELIPTAVARHTHVQVARLLMRDDLVHVTVAFAANTRFLLPGSAAIG